MANLDLFPRAHVVGVFRGFSKSGLEFHADLVLPYRSDFQNIPMHGQFLLVQLETPDEAVLGRITSLASSGKLAIGVGEEFNIRAVRDNRPIPEELREQYLKYEVDIRVLGVVRKAGARLTFVASHRRLPHMGSPVAFLSGPVLQELAGHNGAGAVIGHFALGEYIYARAGAHFQKLDWMQLKEPEVLVKFDIRNIVSRRTFIFARAGFGKSNLNKLLFSKLYQETPTVEKRGGRRVPVGTVLFDPDGEYFWPDDKGRPGLCDVPELQQRLVVFTNRKAPTAYYGAFVAGGIKLDIRRLKPADVIGIALNPERQEQQNVRKLRGLGQAAWMRLVDLIDARGNAAPVDEISEILQLEERQDVEAFAARANMTAIVQMLHDKTSRMMEMLLQALAAGILCIVDVSQLRGQQSLILSSLILRYIFDHNQQEFTERESKTIPTIAVVEEAQAVLHEHTTGAEPYIAWVKEGRKYDLGAVLITQQPGSIPGEILSQGDNWFVFHLLSSADLTALQRANAHFSEDILSAVLNEPIAGQGVFWSSANQTPYPIALRALSFELLYAVRDPQGELGAVATFATQLTAEFARRTSELVSTIENNRAAAAATGSAAAGAASSGRDGAGGPGASGAGGGADGAVSSDRDSAGGPPASGAGDGAAGAWGSTNGEGGVDTLQLYKQLAFQHLRENTQMLKYLQSERGQHWRGIGDCLHSALPPDMPDAEQLAFSWVRDALDAVLGHDAWETHDFWNGARFVKYARVKQPRAREE
jgi:hypothetical protein